MVSIAFHVKSRYEDGRPAFEIPLDSNGDPRGYKQGGGSFYYTADKMRCVCVATKTMESYLRKRKYAKFLGYVKYALDGINHFEWKPEEE